MTPRITSAALLLLLATALGAQDTRPANFDFAETDRRMDALLKFPEIKGDISVVMSCFARIKASGRMNGTSCYLQNNYDEPFARAVMTAGKKAKLNPAIIGGKAREIFLQFRVAFIKEGDNQTIDYYLNPGYEENVNAYGSRHIAGQRVIGRNEPWNDACPKRAKWLVWLRAYLGPDGRADNPTVQHVNGIRPTQSCIEALENTITSSLYTPTLADGGPVPSTFVEPFSN